MLELPFVHRHERKYCASGNQIPNSTYLWKQSISEDSMLCFYFFGFMNLLPRNSVRKRIDRLLDALSFWSTSGKTARHQREYRSFEQAGYDLEVEWLLFYYFINQSAHATARVIWPQWRWWEFRLPHAFKPCYSEWLYFLPRVQAASPRVQNRQCPLPLTSAGTSRRH